MASTRRLLSALALAAALPAVAAAQVTVSGAGTGCFGAGCTNFQDTRTFSNTGLSFDGSSFSTALGLGDVDVFDVGRFSLDGDIHNGTDGIFRLRVNFTSPTGAGQETFDATIDGTFRFLGFDTYEIDFGGPQTVDFNGGSFQMQLGDQVVVQGGSNDVEAYVFGLNRAPASVVPEPSTYMLLGTGLSVLGLVARRRRAAA